MEKPQEVGMVFIYIIGPEGGPYKIGISGNVNERIEAIQATSPVKVFLFSARRLDSRFDAVGFERQVHSSLKEHRLHNEWFNCGLETAKNAIRAKVQPRRPPQSMPKIMIELMEMTKPQYMIEDATIVTKFTAINK